VLVSGGIETSTSAPVAPPQTATPGSPARSPDVRRSRPEVFAEIERMIADEEEAVPHPLEDVPLPSAVRGGIWTLGAGRRRPQGGSGGEGMVCPFAGANGSDRKQAPAREPRYFPPW
jgi:hypothetical protein